MKLQTGSIYMTSPGDLDNPVMGVVVNRMWWKPWRYFVQPIYYGEYGPLRELKYGEPIRNLTKLGVLGTMKLFGVKHRDFEHEQFLGEPK